ncbi:alpha/beta fold hydrolase [Mesorhizobium atlanticum]
MRPLAAEARVLAYDLPGHSHSLQCEGMGGAKPAARAILADLAARQLTKVHLVGHSMGGAVATLMALADSGRVASLTLLAPGGFGPEINAALLRRYAAASGRERSAPVSRPCRPRAACRLTTSWMRSASCANSPASCRL